MLIKPRNLIQSDSKSGPKELLLFAARVKVHAVLLRELSCSVKTIIRTQARMCTFALIWSFKLKSGLQGATGEKVKGSSNVIFEVDFSK